MRNKNVFIGMRTKRIVKNKKSIGENLMLFFAPKIQLLGKINFLIIPSNGFLFA